MEGSICPICGERMTYRLGKWECDKCSGQIAATRERISAEVQDHRLDETAEQIAIQAELDSNLWWVRYLNIEKICWLVLFICFYVYSLVASPALAMISGLITSSELAADAPANQSASQSAIIWALVVAVIFTLPAAAAAGLLWRKMFVKWGCAIAAGILIAFILIVVIRMFSKIQSDSLAIVSVCALIVFFLWAISILAREIVLLKR